MFPAEMLAESSLDLWVLCSGVRLWTVPTQLGIVGYHSHKYPVDCQWTVDRLPTGLSMMAG